MQIECPSCSTENQIEFGENILCSECKKSFAGHAYKKVKKTLLSATSALILGAYGTYKIDQFFFEEQRYPLAFEYELVNNCINSSNTLMSSSRKINKTQLCICALGKTQEKVSFEKMNKSESEFLTHFRSSVRSCR